MGTMKPEQLNAQNGDTHKIIKIVIFQPSVGLYQFVIQKDRNHFVASIFEINTHFFPLNLSNMISFMFKL